MEADHRFTALDPKLFQNGLAECSSKRLPLDGSIIGQVSWYHKSKYDSCGASIAVACVALLR